MDASKAAAHPDVKCTAERAVTGNSFIIFVHCIFETAIDFHSIITLVG